MQELPKVPCLFRERDRHWTLRRRIPNDIRHVIGKHEIWRTYGAVSFEEARRLHSLEMAKWEIIFAEARRSPVTGSADHKATALSAAEPTKADVRGIVLHRFHAEERKADLEDRRLALASDPEEVLYNLRVDETNLRGPEGEAVAEKLLRDLLAGYGFAPPSGEPRHRAVRLVRATLVEGARRSQERVEGCLKVEGFYPEFKGITALGEPPPAPKPAPPQSSAQPIAR